MSEILDAVQCGPECIAELLKRDGKEVNVNRLAKEMKTDNMGTSMQAMADTLKKYGYKPKGLQLTRKGLSQQKMPVITLIMRHFVIIESANILGVNIWDPSSSEINKPKNQHFSNKAWEEIWSGAVITAER